ncbi:transposase [Candidatus Mycobacterium methanotrophicum]|uniref:Transposase n=1 Tax=Candidatus Mycobacterium methanotrophicum TaxID=2943498 RepID=A0ABY4QP41_9MYCO|nr:transposase [Candidatus Mycobacterium methanotrophicum]UQX11731.1 transposase [Candidatus Mycobacterium methanotrophicum]
MRVDWSKRADYIGERHGISSVWAGEAVNDRHAVRQAPDPASQSGLSVRVIGYSPAARTVLTVILISNDADPDERPDGDCWGSNAWVSNQHDKSLYSEEQQE